MRKNRLRIIKKSTVDGDGNDGAPWYEVQKWSGFWVFGTWSTVTFFDHDLYIFARGTLTDSCWRKKRFKYLADAKAFMERCKNHVPGDMKNSVVEDDRGFYGVGR